MSGLWFPDSSNDTEEYDEEAMAGPEALLFKQFGACWPSHPQDSHHTLATKMACPVCVARGWIYVLP